MEIGIVRQVDIESEVKAAYLDYAMSVITARALPDVRDGLKPVQRRILYAMNDMGLLSDKPYKKSARIVGEVLGKYHPHGDMAVYEAMVRMAQDFVMRYTLVDGQGNFGSVDGDAPAAMRYTEARLTPIAEEMLTDIEKDTVDFVPNFDGTLVEPAVLPAKLPNLLLNGASGIAVGMATNIPPHNLKELCDAISYLIDHYDEVDEVSIEDLMKHIKGPDFPTGGLILGMEGIKAAYATGKGRVTLRGVTRIEEIRGGRYCIIITELPYQVNKASLVEKIASLVRAERIDGIADLRDESDRRGMSVVIELKRGADPRTVLNQLYKYTPLQTTYGINLLALVDGEPRLLSLKRALQLYIEHRRDVITRRTRYELAKARDRAHVLEGFRIALAHIDEVIAIIKRSRSAETARKNLRRKLKLTQAQAQAILDMQLRRLAALERRKIEEEYTRIIKTIASLEDLLANPRKVLYLIKKDLADLKARYGDSRRTRILPKEAGEITEEDLIPHEEVLIAITQRGYVKRMAVKATKVRRRGGRGVIGMLTRERDAVLYIFAASTLDDVLFFTDRGRVFQEKAHRLPDSARSPRGLPLVNFIGLEEGERVTAAVAVSSFEEASYLTMATVQGKVKRTPLSEFSSVRAGGLVAIVLEEGDELGWVRLTHGDQELILVTEQGRAIRFREEDVRPMGRVARGVQAIKLAPGDKVASMEVVKPDAFLLIATALGFGKRTPLADYPTQRRYGSGVIAINTKKLADTGPIVAARVVYEEDELAFITAGGTVLHTWVANIPQLGRNARGSRVMRLRKGDTVASVACIERERKAPMAESEATPRKPRKRSTRGKGKAKKRSAR